MSRQPISERVGNFLRRTPVGASSLNQDFRLDQSFVHPKAFVGAVFVILSIPSDSAGQEGPVLPLPDRKTRNYLILEAILRYLSVLLLPSTCLLTHGPIWPRGHAAIGRGYILTCTGKVERAIPECSAEWSDT